jgi:hypothetical protein
MIQEKKIDNLHVLKFFQNVKTRWDSTCHMLIKALHLKKILQKYHDKHETNYLRLIDIEWSQMKYLINLIKLFCVFIKNIDQFKYSTIHQVFNIYDKLFDHLDQARHRLSRKKIAWKKIMLKDLIATNAKLRQYYAKTQDSLNHLYEKATLLSSNKKNAIFQNSNWKIFNDETSWSETYWSAFEEQFLEKYYNKEIVVSSRSKNRTRIDDLNLLLNVDVSFREDENDFIFYRKRDKSSTRELLLYII